MKSKNIEKEFNINIVASFIENKILVVLDKNFTATRRKKVMQKFEEELFDFCSFITGESINFTNLHLYAPIIRKILAEQYPNMQYKIMYYDECKTLTDKEIINGVNKYKEIYGDTVTIKSLKKEIVKTLKKTR